MQKMSPIPIALHIRSARIPVRWTLRTSRDGERVFWPHVARRAVPSEVEEPLDLRARLFKTFNTSWNEEGALDFLNRVGAWQAVEDDTREEWAEGTYTTVSYGHRESIGLRVVPVTMEELYRETQHWYGLMGALRSPAKLKSEFAAPPPGDARPIDRSSFAGQAQLTNTLPFSLEWHGKDPYAVVETITGWELMIATAWGDVVGRAEEQVCARCGTRFTWPRKKKHCRWECGHLDAVKKHKRKLALEKQRQESAEKILMSARRVVRCRLLS